MRCAGADELAGIGIFDQTAVLLADAGRDRGDLDRIASRPSRAAELGHTLMAARRLFDAAVLNATMSRRELDQDVRKQLAVALKVIDAVSPTRAAQVRARIPGMNGQNWQCLPPLSAAFGALARLATRGDQRCRRAFDAMRLLFARLAEIAPDLVVIDLVLAEALCSASPSSAGRTERDGFPMPANGA